MADAPSASPRASPGTATGELLRWRRVDGARDLVGGVSPRESDGLGAPRFRLGSGERIVLRLEPYAVLRVRGVRGVLEPASLELRRSNGSGLQVVESWRRATELDGLLWVAGRARELIVIEGRESSSVPSELRVEIGEVSRPPSPPLRSRVLAIDGRRVGLRRGRDSTSEDWARLVAGEACAVRPSGEPHVRVEVRPLFGPSDGSSVRRVRAVWTTDRGRCGADVLESRFDDRVPTLVDGRACAIGEAVELVVHLEEGERALSVAFDAEVLARAWTVENEPFLFAEANAWPWRTDRAEEPLAARRLEEARKVAADNDVRDGALAARELLRGSARSPRDLDEADAVFDAHSEWRDADPLPAGRPHEQRTASWLEPTLAGPETGTTRVVRVDHCERAVRSARAARFCSIEPGERLEYELPELSAPTAAEVACIRRLESDEELVVEVDGRETQRLVLRASSDAAPEHFSPSLARLGLAVWSWRFGFGGGDTLGGPWARFRAPAPLESVAHAEIVVPAGARRLVVKRAGVGEGKVELALRYRVASDFELDESAYRRAVEELGGLDAARERFWALVRGDRRGVEPTGAARDLTSHWSPLARRVALDADALLAALEDTVSPFRGELLDVYAAASTIEAARRAREAERWLDALREWSRLLREGPESSETVAFDGVHEALDRLGEAWLAEHMWRGALVHARSEETRRLAVRRLERIYALRGDPVASRRLHAMRFREAGDVESLASLARSYVESGDVRAGFGCALLVPTPSAPAEALLLGALREGWVETYDGMLERVPDERTRAYWQAHRSLAEGRYREAAALFEGSGHRGAAHAGAIRAALAVREALDDADLVERCRAIFRWEDWWRAHPGPFRWREDEGLVRRHGGAMRFERADGDGVDRYWLAEPDAPVAVTVLGPATVRIATRPLHERGGSDGPLDGWMVVEGRGWLRPVPITENEPSRSYVHAGVDAAPGQSIAVDIEIGAGRHDLVVHPLAGRLLVRAFVLVPETPIAALPPISEAAMRRVLAGDLFRRGLRAGVPTDGGRVRVRALDSRSELVMAEYERVDEDSAPFVVATRSLPSDLRGRLALRLPGDWSADDETLWLALGAEGLDDGERLLALERLRELPNALRSPESYGIVDTLLRRARGLLAAGHDAEVIDLLEASSGDSSAEIVELLLWIAERDPELVSRARALGQSLLRTLPAGEADDALRRRLSRGYSWRPLDWVEGGAGVRHVVEEGWAPESPILRVRDAILPDLGAHEIRVTGGSWAVFELETRAPRVVRLELSVESAGFAVPAELEVPVRVDDRSVEVLRVGRGERRAVEVELAEGEHRLGVRVERPVRNAWLRVGLLEGDPSRPEAPPLPTPRAVRRRWLVATPERPLHVRLREPALLRIDRRLEDGTESRFELHPGGDEALTLGPQGSEPEALFRVFREEPSESLEAVDIPRPPVAPPPERPSGVDVLRGTGLFEPAVEGVVGFGEWPLDLPSYLPLFEFEGTLSLETAAVRRMDLEEDRDGELVPDEFLETALAYRRRFDRLESWLVTRALARVHTVGGPTIGLDGRWHWDPVDLWDIRVDGRVRGYAQWPGGSSLDTAGDLESSLTASLGIDQVRRLGSRWRHVPALDVFARAVSLDRATARQHAQVDQDVFTPYKEDHLAGWRLSETVVYEPWADTRLWGSVGLTTNEDFNPLRPDNLGLSLGARQQVGDLGLSLAYRVKGFLEDDDRDEVFVRHVIDARGTWDVWVGADHRLEIAVDYRHDFRRVDSSFTVALVWHFGGAGMEHFAPASTSFRALREASWHSVVGGER